MVSSSCNTFTKGHIIHNIQLMLIEADSPIEAFTKVADELNNSNSPQWSDWHEADYSNVDNLSFAGRWQGGVFVNDPDSETTKLDYLRWSDDEALGDLVIQRFINFRMDEIAYLRSLIAGNSTDLHTYPYNPLVLDYAKSMEIYYIKRLAQILSDEWNSDSAFYDLTAWSGNLKYFTERVAKAPEKQFLIPVDFHS